MNIKEILKDEFNLKESQIENTISLIDEGNTIPFIARYRKEMTGNMSDVFLREFFDRLNYLRNLEARKNDVSRLIEEKGKLTDEISLNILNAKTLQEVEDIYAPFKTKKRTKATIAKEKGLENLALEILNKNIENINETATRFINNEKDLNSIEDCLNGAKDIIAEIISDDSNVRKYIRDLILREGILFTKNLSDEDSVYSMYYNFSESVKTIASHRVLAINRGEKDKFLKVKIEINKEKVINYILNTYITKENFKNKEIILESIEDSYKRLIFPSIEREVRNTLTEKAEERAISVFGKNLKNLLLQSPLKNKVVMGFDPAFRTGCKIAIVDRNSKLLDTTTVYPTEPQNKILETKEELTKLIKKYKVDVIAIGNGTASRESEKIVSDIIKETDEKVSYIIVNEAGASVYSASSIANEEHPDINVSLRGAISIARRLQDPLAELVKIEPKSIGVGQYQHDLNQKRLEEVLGGVVEDSVNSVGVDLNTASFSLLSYISGISKSIAKNIVSYREENGNFKSRNELKKVKMLGPKAFIQCAGFLRISQSENPLDNTSVHPESYEICEKMLNILGYSLDDVKNKKISDIDKKVKEYDIDKLSKELNIGKITLQDIIIEIKKPDLTQEKIN